LETLSEHLAIEEHHIGQFLSQWLDSSNFASAHLQTGLIPFTFSAGSFVFLHKMFIFKKTGANSDCGGYFDKVHGVPHETMPN
jgi:hypothetical protein